MKITTDHPASRYGNPVVIDDDGEVLDGPAGLRAVCDRLGLSSAELAAAVNKSPRTAEKWRHGSLSTPAYVLVALGDMLAKRDKAEGREGSE